MRWIVCMLAWGAMLAAARAEDDMARLTRQTREFDWSSLSPNWSNMNLAREWAGRLETDGTWKDVDYQDQTRNFWKTADHLKRTEAMAVLYGRETAAGVRDDDLKAATLSAAHYWISHDFHNPNWWFNEINVPGDMVTILLMMGDAMSPEDRAGALKIVERATFSMTGQNLVWKSGIIFRRALVEGDAALARQARDTILGQLKVTTEEGLQADWSFHQHGPQQQMGNYGLSFAADMVAWAGIWRGTALAMPEDKMALLREFLLKGEAAMTVNATMDISGCGRQLFPSGPRQNGRHVLELLAAMADADAGHAQEYRTAALRDWQPAGAGMEMNWNYFDSDTMVHRRPGFYASVKLCSSRVIGEELVNNENLKGRYLADGAVFLYQTDKEYADIFPVWDWRRVPGVTCVTTGTTLAPAGKMATDFAGGVSDGSYGAEGVDYRRDGVGGKKGWFFLDEGVVCLGAGITGTNVRTSVDQRLAEGATITPAGALRPGVQPCNGAAWVLDGNEGYLFAQPGDVWAGTQAQMGAWKDVYAAGPGNLITRDVFSLWINHTAQPGSYAYTMIPGATVEKLQAYATKPPMAILSNTPEAQAVRDAGVTEALFYKAGAVNAGSLSLSANGPCAVILRAGDVYVADPTQKEKAVTVTINGKALAITLPQGETAGSTVEAKL